MEKIRRWFVFCLRYGLPGALLIVPLAVLYGFLSPWAAGDQALVRYSGDLPVTIGFSSSWSSDRDLGQQSWTTTKVQTRQYFLLRRLLSHPTLVTVTKVNDEEPTAISTNASGVLSGLAFTYLAGMICTWWFWLRPGR